MVDTSVAIPLLLTSHDAHQAVVTFASNVNELGLSGHALAETYSVLTRLPGTARVNPRDAVSLIDDNFTASIALAPEVASSAHVQLARLGVSGGATFDGLVALAARESDSVLVTRDARARPTYAAVGVQVEIIG